MVSLPPHAPWPHSLLLMLIAVFLSSVRRASTHRITLAIAAARGPALFECL